MKKAMFLGTLAAFGLTAGVASAATLDDVQARGHLQCGVNVGLVGFAAPDASGEWDGFDIAYCRALAAAIFGDPKAVRFTPTTDQSQFAALASGEVDILARNSPWTYSRDTDLKLDWVGVNYYDGQGFMVKKGLGVASAKELDGLTVCVQADTPTDRNLADYFKENGMSYEPVPVETEDQALIQFLAGACDVYTSDASGLAAGRATFEDAAAYVVLPEIISKEALGPLVRHGDDQWADIARWVLYALIIAEEKGITSANIDEMAKGVTDEEINRLLGSGTDDIGAMMGMPKTWGYDAIKAGGNYGELFERHLGEKTALGLARGLNALWTQGGLQYAPPVR